MPILEMLYVLQPFSVDAWGAFVVGGLGGVPGEPQGWAYPGILKTNRIYNAYRERDI